jgi:ubiquinone/menaquinone biosynthesis C-methylase UbiE
MIAKKMNNKKEIIDFFDKNAYQWDKREKRKTHVIIKKIINSLKLKKFINVLDVGCGTGILYPYLKNKFKNYTGVDISPKMIEVALKKHPKANFINKDFYKLKTRKKFDLIIVFNSFPHFTERKKFFKKALSLLKNDGKLIIAHSFKLEKINKIHYSSSNKEIRRHLITAKEISNLYKNFGFKKIKIKNNPYFIAEGTK